MSRVQTSSPALLKKSGGAGKVGTSTGGTVQSELNLKIVNLADIAALRAYSFPVSGAVIFVKEYVSGSGHGGGYFRHDASDVVSADNGVTIFVSGSNRAKRILFGEVSVFDGGATGAGDDTSAIQSVINAAGSLVIVGKGYTHSVTSLSLPSGCLMRDLNFITKAGSADFVAPITIDATASAKSGIRLVNVCIDGNRQNQTAIVSATEDGGRHGFRVLGSVTDLVLLQCKANYCAGDGIEIFSVSNAANDSIFKFKNILLEGCEFNWNRRHGLSVEAIDGLTINGGNYSNNGQDLDGVSPLTSGMRGARYGGNLYGRAMDIEDYGLGSGYRNIKIDGVTALGNVSGILFQCSADVTNAGFVPRTNIKILNSTIGATSAPGTEGSVTFYASLPVAGKNAFTEIQINKSNFAGHVSLTSVNGIDIDGKVGSTGGGGNYIVILDSTSKNVKVSDQLYSANRIYYTSFPYNFAVANVSGCASFSGQAYEVISSKPFIIRCTGVATATGAGVAIASFTGAVGSQIKPRFVACSVQSTGLPIPASFNLPSQNVSQLYMAAPSGVALSYIYDIEIQNY